MTTKQIDRPAVVRVFPGLLAIIPSDSKPDWAYELTVAKDSHTLYCSCPAWKFSTPGAKTCKHMKKFLAENPGLAGALGGYATAVEKEIFGEVK